MRKDKYITLIKENPKNSGKTTDDYYNDFLDEQYNAFKSAIDAVNQYKQDLIDAQHKEEVIRKIRKL